MDFEMRNADVAYGPDAFKDKRGLQMSVLELPLERIPPLVEIYKNFDLESQFQGLPPTEMDLRIAWLQGLLKSGIHLIALMKDGNIAGHAALMELPGKKSCEFIIVVVKEHRNNGIGMKLCKASKKWAKTLGYKSIWLNVSASNSSAIYIYKKVGFRVLNTLKADLEMEVSL
jgi:RimJ/RimL family protein N-acetyltransferase